MLFDDLYLTCLSSLVLDLHPEIHELEDLAPYLGLLVIVLFLSVRSSNFLKSSSRLSSSNEFFGCASLCLLVDHLTMPFFKSKIISPLKIPVSRASSHALNRFQASLSKNLR